MLIKILRLISNSRVSFFLLLLVFSVIGIADSGEKKAKKVKLSPVVVTQASIQKLAPISWASGSVISLKDARLAAEVEGRIIKIADVGTRIKKGGVIAIIDDTIVKLKIQEFQAGVNKEQAQLQFLHQEVDRLKRLAKQNNAAKTQLEQTQADAEVANNNSHIATARLNLAKEELERHVLFAPFSGIVSERFTRLGERASIGKEIVRLIDPIELEVQAKVPLTSVNHITEGTELTLSGQKKQIKGVVRTLVPIGDERSRLLDLRISIPSNNWRVGQSVRIALPTEESKDVLVVPRDALVLRRNGVHVYRIANDNIAEKITVTLGSAAGELVEIISEIKSGDNVVIRGGERLRPGQKVEIIVDSSIQP